MLSTPSAITSAMLASSVESDSAILSEENLAFFTGASCHDEEEDHKEQ